MSNVLTYAQQSPVMNSCQGAYVEGMRKSAEEIHHWLIAYLANLVEMKREAVDTTVLFDNHGLDSAAAPDITTFYGEGI